MMGWAPRPQMMMYGECAKGSSGALLELNIKANCVLSFLENASMVAENCQQTRHILFV